MQITIGTSRKTYTTRLFVYSLALIFTQKFAPLRFPLCRALGVPFYQRGESVLRSLTKFLCFLAIQLLFSSVVLADRYGIHDPMDDSPPPPWWLAIYFIAGLWLCVGDKSPMKEWANENAGLCTALFLLVFPALLGFFVGF